MFAVFGTFSSRIDLIGVLVILDLLQEEDMLYFAALTE